jgi:hypothetical protein
MFTVGDEVSVILPELTRVLYGEVTRVLPKAGRRTQRYQVAVQSHLGEATIEVEEALLRSWWIK